MRICMLCPEWATVYASSLVPRVYKKGKRVSYYVLPHLNVL